MKRIKTALIILLLLLVVTVPCSAEESNYIISGKDKIPVSTSYINEAAISDFQGTLNSAQDIFIDENDKMYIADTGNNRVVVAKTDGTVLSVITSADGIELKGPEGVYADNFGSIFVADTGNERILHFSSGGKYIESFLRPESDYLGETYLFNPSKIVVNSTGYIYTLKSQTIMTVDANNRFRGYLGQPDVGFNLSETLIRMFASAEQIKAIKKREAEPYINIDIGKDGLIYATSREIGSEIKVLNSVGENLYRTSTASSRNIFQKITGTFFSLFNIGNYAAKGFQFGENTIVGGKQTAPSFADIAVDNNGIITVINSINNILYQYDSEGNLLFAFGKEEADSGKTDWFTNLRNLPKRYIRLLHYITTAIIMPHTICGLRFWKKARIMSLRKSVWVKHYIKKNVITKLCSNTKMQMSAHCILRLLQNIDTAFSEKISVLQFP